MSAELLDKDDTPTKSKKRKLAVQEEQSAKKMKKHKELPAEDAAPTHEAGKDSSIARKKEKKKKSLMTAKDDLEALSSQDHGVLQAVHDDTPNISQTGSSGQPAHEEATGQTPDRLSVKKKKSKLKNKLPEGTAPSVRNAETSEVEVADVHDISNGGAIPQIEDDGDIELSSEPTFNISMQPSPFHTARISLYIHLPAISLFTALKSVCALHLTPLLLTYYAPADGVILSFSNPVLSAYPNLEPNKPLRPAPDSTRFSTISETEVWAQCADEAGACWVWLTADLLVFRPEKGMKMQGWMNVCSEGFIGLVLLNYWQIGIGKERIPKDWTWSPTAGAKTKKARKIKLKGEELEGSGSPELPHDSQETAINDDNDDDDDVDGEDADGIGYWSWPDGSRVKDILDFRVVDAEVVPAHDRDKWALHIQGTLLDAEQEEQVVEEERAKFERMQNKHSQRSTTSASPGMPMMSGALRAGSEGSVVSGRLS